MWRALLLLIPAALIAQDRPEYKVDKVLAKLGFASSLLWVKEGFLLVSDLPAGKITRLDSKGPSIYHEQLFAGGLAVDRDGHVWACDPRERRIIRFDSKGTKVEMVADRFEGKRFNGPNAVVMSKNGGGWFTDSAFGSARKTAELDFSGLFHVTAKGEVSLAARLPGRAAGLALSPDSKTLYATDADGRSILAWDVDKTNLSANPRVLAKVREGVPNGITAAPDGTLYVAARNVEIYSPSGEYKGTIELSEKPADMTFGDGDMNSLYVAARSSLFRVRFAGKGEKAN